MNKIFFCILLSTFTIFSQQNNNAPSQVATDTIFDKIIVDEYRNFENTKDEKVLQWLDEQTAYTLNHFNNNPLFKQTQNELELLNSRAKTQISSIYRFLNGNSYFLKKAVNEKVSKLYCINNKTKAQYLVFDPEAFAKAQQNDKVFIADYKVSPDETKVAIAITNIGNEFSEIIILDIKNNKILNKPITNTWTKEIGGIVWLTANEIVFTYFPDIDKTSKNYIKNSELICYNIETKEKRILASKNNNPEIVIEDIDFLRFIYNNSKFDDFVYLKISGASTYKDFYYSTKNSISWKKLISKDDKVYDFKVFKDSIYLIVDTDKGRVIKKGSIIDFKIENTKTIIKPAAGLTLDSFIINQKGIYYICTKNGIEAKLYHYNNDKSIEIPLPKKSGRAVFRNAYLDSSNFWISLAGWTQSSTIYNYLGKEGKFVKETWSITEDFPEFNDVVVEELEIKTTDGELLPVSIIYKKGLKKHGKNKTVINVYGSYGISIKPFFNYNSLILLNRGAVIVYPHIRGGGEKGANWHRAGQKENKPNSWKDAIATAEFLIKNKYTSPNYLGITGDSAGGIVSCRAVQERPDLFGAFEAGVGALNMLRSEFAPNGGNSTKEFGTIKKENEFKALYEMDAYHNIKPNTNYPACYISASINDARVAYWEPAKFFAKFLKSTTNKQNAFLEISKEKGHIATNSSQQIDDSWLKSYFFFLTQLGK
ncbi:hypothetical protein EH230_08610 [Flavobacterium columnare]|uniref:Prolyl oligopeptidase n=1 Tax=Flavobacterium columnare TaxID=996 RepID=A0A437UBH0_9FLAO|nr:prolyl oligopeptidase family serine peptidase [Flavobacterium columnare]RVU90951.1 hypothetical protein EH230_08610 [Flavobacterium columnare]